MHHQQSKFYNKPITSQHFQHCPPSPTWPQALRPPPPYFSHATRLQQHHHGDHCTERLNILTPGQLEHVSHCGDFKWWLATSTNQMKTFANNSSSLVTLPQDVEGKLGPTDTSTATNLGWTQVWQTLVERPLEKPWTSSYAGGIAGWIHKGFHVHVVFTKRCLGQGLTKNVPRWSCLAMATVPTCQR